MGRGSGCDDDARQRTYDGYAELPPIDASAIDDRGDALARLRVRWTEIDDAARFIARACERLETISDPHIAARYQPSTASRWAGPRRRRAR
ncbi:NADH-ubiquinone oxidoreductase, chain 49kDa domain protein [Mycobacterium xenopi 3993]|nr:NADH-ubiquinone oxidoreductase, chain 49kDa domain protein [Mycobacterium xenopi 3993]